MAASAARCSVSFKSAAFPVKIVTSRDLAIRNHAVVLPASAVGGMTTVSKPRGIVEGVRLSGADTVSAPRACDIQTHAFKRVVAAVRFATTHSQRAGLTGKHSVQWLARLADIGSSSVGWHFTCS